MKRILGFLASLGLIFVLVSCGSGNVSSGQQVYSFSGENDIFRIVNGVAVIGGEEEVLYGGQLEFKSDGFKDVASYGIEFYIADDSENWTILHNVVKDQNKIATLENQKLGQIAGKVLKENMDVSMLEKNLFFQLEVKDKYGHKEIYTVPMDVEEVTQGK